MAKKYQDFSINMLPHPVTGDISLVSDDKSIAQSIKNIVLMNTYESPFNSGLAGNVRGLLFELSSPFVAEDVKIRIRSAIKNFEPRIDLIDIDVIDESEKNRLLISIIYSAKTSEQDVKLEFYLDRIV